MIAALLCALLVADAAAPDLALPTFVPTRAPRPESSPRLQARMMGKSVILVSPSRHLGGFTRDFFHRIWSHYQKPDAWTMQTKDSFPNHGQHGPAFDSKLEIATAYDSRKRPSADRHGLLPN